MAIIAKRYVQALFNSAKDIKESTMFEEALTAIAKCFTTNSEFKSLMLNPCVSNEEKIETLKEMFADYCKNATFVNFLNELLEKNRIKIIESVADEYTRLNNMKKNEVAIKIIVASTLEEKQIQDIVEKYKKLYNANTIKYEVELDESVIGGVKVIVGNKIYDSTIKTKLAQIF